MSARLRNGSASELICADSLLEVSGPEGQGRKTLRVSGVTGPSPVARQPLCLWAPGLSCCSLPRGPAGKPELRAGGAGRFIHLGMAVGYR